jgi:hypothetical protein
MIPVATEKAGLPDDWSVLGAAVFVGIGVVVVRPHLYSIRSPPQEIVVATFVLRIRKMKDIVKWAFPFTNLLHVA